MNKQDFVAFIDGRFTLPNGEGGSANMPRHIVETLQGYITDVCLKRKVRNYIDLRYGGLEGMGIFIRHGVPKDKAQYEAINSVPKPKNKSLEEMDKYATELKKWMCDHFWDVRTFGAVCQRFNAKEKKDKEKENTGKEKVYAGVDGAIRGAVQIGFAESVDPITIERVDITSCAVANEEEAANKNNTMGTKYVVPYAMYKVTGHILPHIAKKNGFTEEDLEKFFNAFLHMFEIDHSAARGEMAVKKLFVFEHENEFGSAFEDDVVNSVKVEKKIDGTPTKFEDYAISVTPIKGVTVKELR